MKKIICLGLVLCGFFGFSQQREKGAIEVAPIVGSAASNYFYYTNDKLSNDPDPISSVNFGVNGDYYFNNRWSLRSGLLFQRMGSEYDLTPLGGEMTKDKLDYLTLPANANWHFGKTRKWNLNFGPSLGFLLSAKSNDRDIKDHLSSFQLGFNFGVGYKFEIKENIGILIDYQGMGGLTGVTKEGADIKFGNVYSSFNLGCVIRL